MARTGRPKADLTLADVEREQLLRWARRAKSAQSLALRSKIILRCADGMANTAVAAQLGCSEATVGKWRRRFVAEGLDGLTDEPRPGAPRSVSDEQVEQVVVATLERTPRDATHWSRASMATETGLSRSTVGRIWRAFGLKPHLVDTFKLSSDPLFIEKVRDVVGLYLNPPERAVVLSVDEKSGIQALNRSSPFAADDARDRGPAQFRLRPRRHHRPVRRLGRGHRAGHPLHPATTSRGRAQEVPGFMRPTGALRPIRPTCGLEPPDGVSQRWVGPGDQKSHGQVGHRWPPHEDDICSPAQEGDRSKEGGALIAAVCHGPVDMPHKCPIDTPASGQLGGCKEIGVSRQTAGERIDRGVSEVLRYQNEESE